MRRGTFALGMMAGIAAGTILLAAPQDFQFPGSQPLVSITDEFVRPETMDPADYTASLMAPPCAQCHTGVDPVAFPSDPTAARPLFPWQGSMMAMATRDPLFFAQLDIANSDHTIRPEVAGVGDMCLRCHTPVGWLEGRSTIDSSGMALNYKDIFGVQCHFCHRLVDPLAAGLPPSHFDITGILSALPPDPGVPPTYGNGMYVVDPSHLRRGPYDSSQMTGHGTETVPDTLAWASSLAAVEHPAYGSPFHRSSNLCGTCHDVSLPFGCPDGANTQSCFAIERTWTEWRHSSFFAMGESGNCQSCHMSGPLNGVAFGAPCEGGGALDHLNDIHVHDLTGGNAFIPRVIAYWKDRYDTCEAASPPGSPALTACLNFKAALNGLYPPAGQNPFKYVSLSALEAGRARVLRTLARAAYLDAALDPADLSSLLVTVTNRTGHKLPTGYPEGRRMWLNVRFLDQNGQVLAESGRYDAGTGALHHDQNLDGLAGSKTYDRVTYTNAAGAALASGRPTKVWEGRLKRAADGREFHFALNDTVVMDNRIPPAGWSPTEYGTRGATPVVPAVYSSSGWQSSYEDPVDGPLNRDTSDFDVPAGTNWIDLRLYYQTMSREYLEQLVADNPNTLTAGGYNRATLLQEAWNAPEVGRSEPVEMARQVVVVVDADTDGLPDGWEDDFAPPVTGARNGDDDGDGRNNWQELLAGSDPTVAADTRKPVDIVLLLDMSGSMNDPAPKSSIPKIDLLKDAAALFLETWKDYSIPADRIGVVYFRTTATYSPVTPTLVSFNDNWQGVKTEIEAQTASGWTAMGAGLHLSLQMLGRLIFTPAPDTSRAKHVLFFSNGMQNRSPIVGDHPSFSTHLEIRAPGAGDIPVTGDSNPGLTLPITVLRPNSTEDGPEVHTIGIGVREDPGGTSWHDLLREVADKQLGHHAFITDAYELEGSFLSGLVETLKGNTLGSLFEHHRTLGPPDEQTIEFPIHATASKFSVVVSWAGSGADRVQLEPRLVRPDGKEDPLRHLIRRGPGYLIITRYLDDADHHPEHFGAWKLSVRLPKPQAPRDGDAVPAPKSLPIRLHGFVDETALQFTFGVNARQLRVGAPLRAWVRATRGNQNLRRADLVRVEVSRPGAGVGEALARSRHKLADPAAYDPDLVANPLARKQLAAFSDRGWAARFKPIRQSFDLRDDGAGGDNVAGDGEFARELMRLEVPGTYQVKFHVRFHDGTARHVERDHEVTVLVRIGAIDAAASRIRRVVEGAKTFVQIRPRDGLGNLLGPGYADRIVARISSTGIRLRIEDLLDGTYRVEYPPGAAADTPVKLSLWGQTMHDGPVRAGIGRWPLWLLLLVLLILAFLVWWWWIARGP